MNGINEAMEVEKQNTIDSTSSTPDVSPSENHHSSTLGTVIPNRIFVGGIDYKVNVSELRHIFSQHGAVKEVKIVIDRLGMSKGYGFVTFESQEDALKILNNASDICFKDKKLSIGQAVQKHQISRQTKSPPKLSPEAATPQQISCGTSSVGYPHTYHNGVAYVYSPNANPPAFHWPPEPPQMRTQPHQPFHQQPAYHHYQCVPNQPHWSPVQPMPSSSAVYSQQSGRLYHPPDGGSFQAPVPIMGDTTTEFLEPTVQHYYPIYPQRAEGMTPIILQHDPGKSVMFPSSRVHLKSKYQRFMRHRDYTCLPDAREQPDASTSYTSQPPM
ncbi:protein boule-like isoform X2 [Mugil cephalus]|uniref:protein boule-like isoform X2 n=1 Tax=Mugil cephalus TaxID=48193 RepID=UPI001FB5A439|nr:protein boule-like isoform X2 [Mugil cephalus]